MLNNMPDDVILNVLQNENPNSLITIAQVSKRFHTLANHSSLTLFQHKKEMDAHVHWIDDICLVAKKSNAVINNCNCNLLFVEPSEIKHMWYLSFSTASYILSPTHLYYRERDKPNINVNIIDCLIIDNPTSIKDLKEKLSQKEGLKTLTPHDQEIITAKTGHTHQVPQLYRIYLTRNKEILKFNGTNLDLRNISKENFDTIVKSMKEGTASVINNLESLAETIAIDFRPFSAASVILSEMSEILAQASEKNSLKLK